MLLHDLTIENYRSFAKYKLSNLARVNLLVGDNNCGKTSVLEAVALLCSTSPRKVVTRILYERGDVDAYLQSKTQDTYWLDFKRSMFNRTKASSQPTFPTFQITSGEKYDLICSVGSMAALKKIAQDPQSHVDQQPFNKEFWDQMEYFAYFDMRLGKSPQSSSVFMQSDAKGRLRIDSTGPDDFDWLTEDPSDAGPMSMMWIGSPSTNALAANWTNIVKNRQDSVVVDAVRVALPAVDDVIFLPNSNGPRSSRLNILLGVTGTRVPISEFGEGTARLLSLGMVLGNTARGIAVIDEIDTGLHYLRLPDMWRMVLKTAAELDVQVFATTHSLDCIRALAEAVENEPALADEVAIFRIDRRFDEAVHFGGDALSVIVNHEIEVR